MKRKLFRLACLAAVSLLGFLAAAGMTSGIVAGCVLIVGGVDIAYAIDMVNTLLLIVILYQTIKHRLETEK